jgi:hypothetical protein
MFSGENEGATVVAHNFKGYDSLPILEYLYQNGVKPTSIANGAKNMYIEVPGCRVRMIDSINFLPSALSELPKMWIDASVSVARRHIQKQLSKR